MLWIAFLAVIFIVTAFMYSKRYTSTRRIGGLYLVQFYNLLIATPLIVLALFNIALEIFLRPEVVNIPISSRILYSLFCLALTIGAIGSGIHATSTSVAQSFPIGSRSRAYFTNEVFHGVMSHDMLYLAGIMLTVILTFLEINHPISSYNYSLETLISVGILIGICQAMGVVWSTHIGVNLIAAFFGTFIVLYTYNPFINWTEHPLAVIFLVSLGTIFITLGVVGVIYLKSKRLSDRLVRFIFPKGHPFREVFTFL
jgi:hypothetical protein